MIGPTTQPVVTMAEPGGKELDAYTDPMTSDVETEPEDENLLVDALLPANNAIIEEPPVALVTSYSQSAAIVETHQSEESDENEPVLDSGEETIIILAWPENVKLTAAKDAFLPSTSESPESVNHLSSLNNDGESDDELVSGFRVTYCHLVPQSPPTNLLKHLRMMKLVKPPHHLLSLTIAPVETF